MRLANVLVTVIAMSLSALVEAGPLHDAIKDNDLSRARTLIAEGEQIDEIDYLSGSPLHIASVRGNVEVVEMLMTAGADINSQEFGKNDTPLHWAALEGHAAIIEKLVLAGSDIDARNDSENTPLHIATDSGHSEAAKKLIELGADLTARNQRGDAAMHLAGKAEMFDIVELLKSKGAQQLPPEEIGPLLDLADPERGKERFLAKCDYCHALRETSNNDVGPSLWNIVGRSQSTQEGFDYSAALRRLEGKWDYESLNLLLLDSRAYFPGSNMRRGNSAIMITEPRDRADIISFLRLQSTEPLPLP